MHFETGDDFDDWYVIRQRDKPPILTCTEDLKTTFFVEIWSYRDLPILETKGIREDKN